MELDTMELTELTERVGSPEWVARARRLLKDEGVEDILIDKHLEVVTFLVNKDFKGEIPHNLKDWQTLVLTVPAAIHI
jgi:hypothetical protein